MKSGQVILICGMFLFAFFLISGTSVRPYGWAPEIGPGLIFPVMAITLPPYDGKDDGRASQRWNGLHGPRPRRGKGPP